MDRVVAMPGAGAILASKETVFSVLTELILKRR